MRLEVTRKSDLAAQALLALATAAERLKAAELAEKVGATTGFLSQAMTPLVTSGWVRSEPGPNGGYALAVDPSTISVLAVIEEVEGPTESGRCVLENRPCGATGPCALHAPWSSARARLLEELDATTIASLLPSTNP